MPNRTGMPSTRSIPLDCSVKISLHVSGFSSRTPLASPWFEMTDWAVTTERALPWPLAAAMSAWRHSGVHETLASGDGPVKVLNTTLVGSMVEKSIGRGGGGTTLEI